MKKAGHILLVILMTVSLANCSQDDGGGKKGSNKAKAPDRGDCLYDVTARSYRHSDGSACDYSQYYNGNACYNYYFQPHTDYTRSHGHYNSGRWNDFGGYYTDEHGRRVDCSLEYLDMQTYLPYNFYHPGSNQYVSGCHYWGQGLIQVPMGHNAYVCAYYNQQFQYNYSLFNNYHSPYYGYSHYYYPSNNNYYYSNGNSNNGWANFGKAVGLGALLWGIYEVIN